MKLIYFTDLHVNKYTQFSEHRDRLKDCLLVLNDVFKLAATNKSQAILFGGDLGDLPKWIYIKVINALMRRFGVLFEKYPAITLYAISGNHDHNEKNYKDKPADTLLTTFATAFTGRFVVIDNNRVLINSRLTVFGIPYYESSACYSAALEHQSSLAKDSGTKNVLLIHQTPEGIYNKHIKADTSPADPRYKPFSLVLCGHIHKPQKLSDRFIVGGNSLHRDAGDMGDDKGLWVFDSSDPQSTLEFVSRKGRYPEFIRKDASKITEEDRKTSFVIPIAERVPVIVEGSADSATFNTSLDMKKLIENYWKQVNGKDEKLLKVGLSLCEEQ